MKKLYVALYGQIVAELQQDSSGTKKLVYTTEAKPTAELSVALPYRKSPYPKKQTMPFIEGLIPEGESVRQSLAREYNLSSWKNPFGILEKIGLECAGAVQFITPEDMEHYPNLQGELIPVSRQDIENRLQRLNTTPGKSWQTDRERWSLAGAQSKFALHFSQGQWYEATGAQPTTHIFKPGIYDLKDQALNEHLCLRALGELGLPVAQSSYQEFGQQAAIVIKRYDRLRFPNGFVVRLHQEDICQALSALPEKKYESSGGPSAVQIIRLLQQVCPQEDTETFIQGLIANYLLGAPDAHAKNYSLLHLPDGVTRLAPFYDVASGIPYEHLSSNGIPGKNDGLEKAAMAIGGERRFGKITRKHWNKFAQATGVNEERLRETVEYMCVHLPQTLEKVCLEEQAALGKSELAQRLIPGIKQMCDTTLTMLDRDY